MPLPTIYGPDSWGAIQIPLVDRLESPVGVGGDPPAGDPALYYIGTFLQAFLSTDQNVLAQWDRQGIAPGMPVVKSVIFGSPNDPGYSFRTSDLTSLFLWREPAKFSVLSDDFDRDDSTLHIAWMLPLGQPQNTRSRLPFGNALAKGMKRGIDIGRTPSWIVKGETEPFALGGSVWAPASAYTGGFDVVVPIEASRIAQGGIFAFKCTASGTSGASEPQWPSTIGQTVIDGSVTWTCAGATPQGSSLWKYAAFAQLRMQESKPALIRIKNPKGELIQAYPGIDTSWLLFDQMIPGITNRPVSQGGLNLEVSSVQNPPAWSAITAYAVSDQVVPLASPNGFFFQCAVAGVSGNTEPTWPTTVGATVVDGSVTWTCVGPVSAVALSANP